VAFSRCIVYHLNPNNCSKKLKLMWRLHFLQQHNNPLLL